MREAIATKLSGPVEGGAYPSAEAWEAARPIRFLNDWQGKNADPQRATEVRLLYRHLNQAEPWRMVSAALDGDRARATIPADYTDTPYPLEYFFEIISAAAQPALFPGLGANLTQPPYFVLRQAS